MTEHWPELPKPFGDCRNYLIDSQEARPTLSLAAFLEVSNIEPGIDAILRKWGPGDRRAAASLWSQGYFMRSLHPLLAYGALHDRWLALDITTARVSTSEMFTAAGFWFQPAQGLTHGIKLACEHIESVAALLASATKTSPRLHRSNAGYLLCRAMSQLPVSALGDEEAARSRRTTLADEVSKLLSRWGLSFDAGPDGALRRSVCCLRYNLANLHPCEGACPIGIDRAR